MVFLVVEDAPEDAAMMIEALTSWRRGLVRVEQCPTLKAAIACAKDHPINLAILDLGLPDSDDIETIERFHTAHPAVPILVFSVNVNERSTPFYSRSGATFCVPKLPLEVLAEMSPERILQWMLKVGAMNALANWRATQEMLESMSAVPAQIQVIQERQERMEERQGRLEAMITPIAGEFQFMKQMCVDNRDDLQEVKGQISIISKESSLTLTYVEKIAGVRDEQQQRRWGWWAKVIGWFIALASPIAAAWAAWRWKP